MGFRIGITAASVNFGEANLSAADGVVAHKSRFGVSDHPGRCRGHPSSRGGDSNTHLGRTMVLRARASQPTTVCGRFSDPLYRNLL